MTSRVIVLADECGGASEKGVRTGGDDDGLGFALLACRTGETLVADGFGLGERFASESGLVDRDVDGFVEPTVRWDDVTNLECNDVAWD
jgi:hypothetical protein